jgi:hypothetical protein
MNTCGAWLIILPSEVARVDRACSLMARKASRSKRLAHLVLAVGTMYLLAAYLVVPRGGGTASTSRVSKRSRW